MSNVHYVDFCPWGILQSDFAQSQPFQVMDRAGSRMPPNVRGTLIVAFAGRATTPDEAWHNILFDCAVNNDMFIGLIEGESIVIRHMDDSEGDLIIPLSNVFNAAEAIMEIFTQPEQDWLWVAAESALKTASRSMMQ